MTVTVKHEKKKSSWHGSIEGDEEEKQKLTNKKKKQKIIHTKKIGGRAQRGKDKGGHSGGK